MVQLLPDCERRHLLQFYFFSKWDYYIRLIWAGGLIGAGLLVQLSWLPFFLDPLFFFSLLLLLVGTFLLLVRGFDLKPANVKSAKLKSTGQQHEGAWEKTTRDRFRQVCTMESQVKRWDEVLTDITCISGVVIIVMIAGGVALLWLVLQSQQT